MLQIAEYLPPTPSPLWILSKQAGVDYAVGGLPSDATTDDPKDHPWDYVPLQRMQQGYETAALAWPSSKPGPR